MTATKTTRNNNHNSKLLCYMLLLVLLFSTAAAETTLSFPRTTNGCQDDADCSKNNNKNNRQLLQEEQLISSSPPSCQEPPTLEHFGTECSHALQLQSLVTLRAFIMGQQEQQVSVQGSKVGARAKRCCGNDDDCSSDAATTEEDEKEALEISIHDTSLYTDMEVCLACVNDPLFLESQVRRRRRRLGMGEYQPHCFGARDGSEGTIQVEVINHGGGESETFDTEEFLDTAGDDLCFLASELVKGRRNPDEKQDEPTSSSITSVTIWGSKMKHIVVRSVRLICYDV